MSSERLLMSLFLFSVGGVAGSSFFELSTESKTIFTLGRAWSTASLLEKSEVNCSLVEGNWSRDEACNSTNVSVGISVELTGLAMRIEGLFNGKG
jgi:hypothetical protein